MDILEKIKLDLLKEDNLSKFATKSVDAIRMYQKTEDIRPPFFHDIDTIIHSTSYTRYIDKTQVYSFLENDNISKRMLHVQLVSKIARTIGRCLKLNEDLIEAIALGHDIGHTPIGHEGEKILNEISLRELGIPFMHNLQSVRNFIELRKDNLSIQVLDGIMCHNGEMLSNVYKPKSKTIDEFLDEYNEACKSEEVAKHIRPMTLEGCVVRISDIIAYIGRDIEDAIRIGRLKKEELPSSITKVLGDNNSKIINTVILDIVKNSYGKDSIIMSDAVYNALFELKKFNYGAIYNKSNSKEDLEFYKNGMNILFDKFLSDLNNKNTESVIYKTFISDMSDEYINGNDNKKIVIDFIAGMTDDYFVNLLNVLTKKS